MPLVCLESKYLACSWSIESYTKLLSSREISLSRSASIGALFLSFRHAFWTARMMQKQTMMLFQRWFYCCLCYFVYFLSDAIFLAYFLNQKSNSSFLCPMLMKRLLERRISSIQVLRHVHVSNLFFIVIIVVPYQVLGGLAELGGIQRKKIVGFVLA